MVDYSEHYRNTVILLSNNLDELITNIDPAIYHSGIGRSLIAQHLIKKAIAILVEELDHDVANKMIVSFVNPPPP